jgi:hypothetical protein
MAHDLSSSIDSSVLLVRDVAGAYRPAQADEVLQAAQRLLWQQLRARPWSRLIRGQAAASNDSPEDTGDEHDARAGTAA